MTPESARVSLGASLLDQSVPGWENRTDLTVFHIGSDVAGILGQHYGSYWGGLDALFPNARSGAAQQRLGVMHGFFWDMGHSLNPKDEAAALEYAWEREIAARRIGRAA
jgi:hypothetical protein